jgi:hypothetical protein
MYRTTTPEQANRTTSRRYSVFLPVNAVSALVGIRLDGSLVWWRGRPRSQHFRL